MTDRITITGADDGADPDELARLSEEFPFVEWGILWSDKRNGTPRYPSIQWLGWLYSAAIGTRMNLSVHLCGAASRQAAEHGAGVAPLRTFPHAFARLQLNGWVPEQKPPVERLWRQHGVRTILQVRELDHMEAAVRIARGANYVLWDPSGGRGIRQSEWPPWPINDVGYAGGIGPANVRETMRELPRNAGWLDMESGVRTGDKWDSDKVRAVLEAAECELTYKRAGSGIWGYPRQEG